ARITHWETVGGKRGKTSAKTTERYRQLLTHQIEPHIGAKVVQKLSTTDIEAWHAKLQTSGRQDGKGGVSRLTARHAHRLLSQALDDAVRHQLAVTNVAAVEGAPAGSAGDDGEEMAILTTDQQRAVLSDLQGKELYAVVATAL